jgi:hypothetical protein
VLPEVLAWELRPCSRSYFIVKLRQVLSCLPIATALITLQCVNPSVVVLTNNGVTLPSVVSDSVRITTEFMPDRGYMEIGYLFIQEAELEKVVHLARKRAGEAGGDAIMNARVGVNIKQVGSFLSFPIYDKAYFVRGIVVRRKREL